MNIEDEIDFEPVVKEVVELAENEDPQPRYADWFGTITTPMLSAQRLRSWSGDPQTTSIRNVGIGISFRSHFSNSPRDRGAFPMR